MEMEHINDDLIKVLIDTEDLEERGIDFLDLIGDQSRIEKFFYSILEEVDVDRHFHDTEAVTFQVIPNSEGLELYISRANLEEMDEIWEDELTKRLRERKLAKQAEKENAEATTDSNSEAAGVDEKETIDSVLNLFNPEYAPEENTVDTEEETEEVVIFGQLEDFLHLAREISDLAIQSDLYMMNHHYYLVLHNLESFAREYQTINKLFSLFEYGETVPVTSSVLIEHGQLLREEDAISFFGSQF